MIKNPLLTEQDAALRRILKDMVDDINNEDIIKSSFKFMSVVITKAETNLKIPHGLGFQPKDLIVTNKSGSNNYTINYDLFDTQNINITTTGAMTLRMLVGRYN